MWRKWLLSRFHTKNSTQMSSSTHLERGDLFSHRNASPHGNIAAWVGTKFGVGHSFLRAQTLLGAL